MNYDLHRNLREAAESMCSYGDFNSRLIEAAFPLSKIDISIAESDIREELGFILQWSYHNVFDGSLKKICLKKIKLNSLKH